MATYTSKYGAFAVTGISVAPEVISFGDSGEVSVTIQNTSGVKISRCYAYLSLGFRRSDGEKIKLPGTVVLYGGEGSGWDVATEQDINWPNGASKTFTAAFRAEPYSGDAPAELDYIIDGADIYGRIVISPDGAIAFPDDNAQDVITLEGDGIGLTMMGYRDKPRLSLFIDRTPNDEAETVAVSAKLSADVPLANLSAHGYTLKLYASNDGEAAETDEQIAFGPTLAELYAGVEASTAAIARTFGNGLDWHFLLVMENGHERQVARASIARAFANMHLSGLSTGGVAFGGFSASEPGKPKLESYYPIHAYKGFGDVNGESFLTQIGIQGGVTEAVSVPAGSYKDIEVSFPKAYADAEIAIVVCIQSELTAGNVGRMTVGVASRSQVGCVLRVYNGDGSARAPGVSWMAMGRPNSGGPIVVSYSYPAAAMTANSSQSCEASASSRYSSSYAEYMAFDGKATTGWASGNGTVSGGSVTEETWLQLQIPVALENIAVDVYARDNSNIGNPTAGAVLGSTDGLTFVEIGSFSGWSSSAKDGELLGTVECNNATPYNYIRLSFTAGSAVNYIAVGEVEVRGSRTRE